MWIIMHTASDEQEIEITVDISVRYLHIRSEVSEVAQSCLTLCDPMDCSLPGFSVHGIFQARLLEWVAISISEIFAYQKVDNKFDKTPENSVKFLGGQWYNTCKEREESDPSYNKNET